MIPISLVVAFVAGVGFGQAMREMRVGQTLAEDASAKVSQGRRQAWKFNLIGVFYLLILIACIVLSLEAT